MQRAEAEGIRLLREAHADEAVLRIRALETFTKVSNGRSTKIIIPSDLQNMSGLVSALRESSSPFNEKEELHPSMGNSENENVAAPFRNELQAEDE